MIRRERKRERERDMTKKQKVRVRKRREGDKTKINKIVEKEKLRLKFLARQMVPNFGNLHAKWNF